MRFLVVAVVSLALVAAFAGTGRAVGYQVIGKEECDCSPLVARGVVPDTLNNLHEAFNFPTLFGVVDQLAMDVKAFVNHFMGSPEASSSESARPTEEPKTSKEKPASTTDDKLKKKEEPAKEEKVRKEEASSAVKKTKPTRKLKHTDKSKKKIKVPPKAKERTQG